MPYEEFAYFYSPIVFLINPQDIKQLMTVILPISADNVSMDSIITQISTQIVWPNRVILRNKQLMTLSRLYFLDVLEELL